MPPRAPLASFYRETIVLDHFIALKAGEDIWLDDSELHLEQKDRFRDLFNYTQPKARLEDLVRIYGVRKGFIEDSSAPQTTLSLPISSSSLSIKFFPCKAGLMLNLGAGRRRTIVEVPRMRGQTLEVIAEKIVNELRIWGHSR